MRVSYHPKIYKDLNGAGCHVNVSTAEMRKSFPVEEIEKVMKKFKKTHKEHLKVYGVANEMRLTGEHETSSFDKFNWGVADRSASVRIPAQVIKQGFGYFEDRRPAATCDRIVIMRILFLI